MQVPPKDKNGLRYYGRWAGNPVGRSGVADKCAAEIPNHPSWTHVQCSRKPGHGPDGEFCKQHAAILAQQEDTPGGS